MFFSNLASSRRTPNTWPSARCLAISSSWVSWEKWKSSTTPSYTGKSSCNYFYSFLIIYQNSEYFLFFFLHRCCEQLLVGRKKQPLSDQAEDLECLCHLIRTCGKNLDSTVGKVHYLVQRFVSSSNGSFSFSCRMNFICLTYF